MTVKVFGLAEAKRAGEFAKTDDQRKTVLAVVRMFGIPIAVEGQAMRKITNMDEAIKKSGVKISRLKEKMSKVRIQGSENITSQSEAVELSRDWFYE